MTKQYSSFSEFYQEYMQAHQHPMCRRLHFIGTILGAFFFVIFILSWNFAWLVFAFIVGYGLAWSGHFFFEKNEPMSFRNPFYSFIADWVMLKDLCAGKLKF